jgi:hypothetical protein
MVTNTAPYKALEKLMSDYITSLSKEDYNLLFGQVSSLERNTLVIKITANLHLPEITPQEETDKEKIRNKIKELSSLVDSISLAPKKEPVKDTSSLDYIANLLTYDDLDEEQKIEAVLEYIIKVQQK